MRIAAPAIRLSSSRTHRVRKEVSDGNRAARRATRWSPQPGTGAYIPRGATTGWQIAFASTRLVTPTMTFQELSPGDGVLLGRQARNLVAQHPSRRPTKPPRKRVRHLRAAAPLRRNRLSHAPLGPVHE